MKGYVTVTTLAHRLGRSPRTVRYWCERGRIPGAWNVGAGTTWLIPTPEAERLIGAFADVADLAKARPAAANPDTMTP